jgi:alkylhydroperoxidase family enzyme
MRTMAWLPALALTEVDYANSFIFDPPRYGNVPTPDGDPASGIVLFPQSGFLDRVTKELVINLVSLLNRSRYSITHHSVIGYTTLSRNLPQADHAERARVAELMLLRLVDSTGRPDYENQTYPVGDRTEPLYGELHLHCLRLAEAVHDDPHGVTDAQFAALRTVLRAEAEEAIAKGPLANAPGSGTEAYLDAYVNGMLVELTWCIAHFDGLLNTWFTVLRVMDETTVDSDGIDFVTVYNSQVPERIKVRNNNLLGTTGWGR